MKPDTRPRPDHDRLGFAKGDLESGLSCLKTGNPNDRATAARFFRDAAYILYEQAERIMQDGYRPDFMFLPRAKK